MILWIQFLGYFYSGYVLAAAYRLEFDPTSQGSSEIKWDESENTRKPELKTSTTSTGETRHYVAIQGTSQNTGATLLLNETVVPCNKDGVFKIEVDITGDHTPFTLLSINDAGDIEALQYELIFSEWSAFQNFQAASLKELQAISKKGRFSYAGSLRFSYLNYQEPSQSLSFSQLSLIAIASGRFDLIQDRMGLDGQALLTLLPIYISVPRSNAFEIKLNFDLDYKVLKKKWGLDWNIFLGFTTQRMIVPDATFGLGLVIAPELGLKLNSDFNQPKEYSFYMKYSPLYDGLSMLPFTNFVLSLGGNYPIGKLIKRPLKLGIDLSQFQFVNFDNVNKVIYSQVLLGLVLQL